MEENQNPSGEMQNQAQSEFQPSINSMPQVSAALTQAPMPGPIDLIKKAFPVFKANAKILLGISLLSVIVGLLGSVSASFPPLAIALLILSVFIGLFVPVSLAIAVSSIMNGLGIGIGDSFRQSLKKIIPLAWMGIISSAIVMGAAFPLIIPGIIVSVLFSQGIFVLLNEDRRGLDALLRSRQLVKGNWWRVISRAFAFGIIFFFPVLIISGIVNAVIYGPEFFSMTALEKEIKTDYGGMISNVLWAFVYPLYFIYLFLIYRYLANLHPAETFDPQDKRSKYKALGIWGIFAIIITIVLFGAIILGAIYLMTQGNAPGSLPDLKGIMPYEPPLPE